MKITTKLSGYSFIVFFWSVLLMLLFLLGMHIYTLKNGPSVPGSMPWDFTARSFYIGYGRNIIQNLPDCVTFDNRLLYKPRDGACEFNNAEFKTVINSKDGARINPYLNEKPTVIILGDSYAQGWGVNDDETTAAILTKKYALPTLSLGMSSYGTAREVEALRRYLKQNNQHPKYIVIMYCNNDWEENIAYLKNGFTEKTQIDYRKLFEFKGSPSLMEMPYKNIWANVKSFRYGLGMWFKTIPFGDEYSYIHGPDRSVSINEQMNTFKSVINQNIDLFKSSKIIVTGFYGWAAQDKFSIELSKNPYLADGSRLEVMQNKLISRDYYQFDGHMNQLGNEDLARNIASLLNNHKY